MGLCNSTYIYIQESLRSASDWLLILLDVVDFQVVRQCFSLLVMLLGACTLPQLFCHKAQASCGFQCESLQCQSSLKCFHFQLRYFVTIVLLQYINLPWKCLIAAQKSALPCSNMQTIVQPQYVGKCLVNSIFFLEKQPSKDNGTSKKKMAAQKFHHLIYFSAF